MHFTDAVTVVVVDTNLDIIATEECGQILVSSSGETDHRHVPVMGGMNGLHQVARVCAKAEYDQYIPGAAQGFYLSAENFTNTVVMADSRDQRAVVAEADGGKSGSFQFVLQ